MSKLPAAMKRMEAAGKALRPSANLSKDPDEAKLEKKLLVISDRVKKEGIQ